MLDAEKRRSLTEMMQNHFTDLDIERDEPFRFKAGKYVLIIDTVPFIRHDIFLLDMFNLVTKYGEIFYNIDFLTTQNLRDENEVNRLVNQVVTFQANKKYSAFKKDSIAFITKWGYVAKLRGERVAWIKNRPRLARRVIMAMQPDVFIKCLFLSFVRNYDIVKKNTLQFLAIFRPETSPTETSSTASPKPSAPEKFPESRCPEWYLEQLAQRSRMQ